MSIPEYFKDCSDFSADTLIADIPIIPLRSLRRPQESRDFFEACIANGLFLLDLGGSETGENLLKDAQAMFEVSKSTFDLDHEVLLKHACHPPRDLRGYEIARAFFLLFLPEYFCDF